MSDETPTVVKPPLYIGMDLVAQILGWRTERARRWLQRSEAAFKKNGRWVTTPRLLREHFAEIYDSIGREFA